jgi:hypothetical protein
MCLAYLFLTYFHFLHFPLSYVNIYAKLYQIWYNFASWSFHASFYNTIYNKLFIIILKNSYWQVNKYLDKGFFEYFGPFGIYKSIRLLHQRLHFTWYSVIFFSISFMFIGVTIFVGYWLFIISLIYIYIIKNLGLLPILFLSFFFFKD